MDFSGQYLTFKEFQELNDYKEGTLAEMPFNLLEFQARKLIDKYTSGRLKSLSTQIQEVKLCILNLIYKLNSVKTKEESNKKGVASENTNGYSVTYESLTTEKVKAINKEIKAIIYDNLSDCYFDNGIPYLYRG